MLPKRWSKTPVVAPPTIYFSPDRKRPGHPLSPETVRELKRVRVTPVQNVTMATSIGNGFLHTLRHMTSDITPVVPPSRIPHPLYTLLSLLIQQEKQHKPHLPETVVLPVLPIRHKADEDALLLRPTDTDPLCCRGDDCEGFQMALDDPHTPTERGFCCKQWTVPNPDNAGVCLLCLRKEVTIEYFQRRRQQRHSTNLLAPFRNIIGQEGEYRADASLFAIHNQMDGLTDAFISHERHHYLYDDDGIKQVNVGFFDNPPKILKALPMKESEVEGILGGLYPTLTTLFGSFADTKRFHKLEVDEDASRLRVLTAYQCLHRQPTARQLFYLQLFIDYQSARVDPEIRPFHYGLLQDAVHGLSFCNFFRDNTVTDLPFVHLMTKSLPQRCQFRNMKKICLAYCRDKWSIWKWMRQCVLCSLCGYYLHTTTFIPYRLRTSIQRTIMRLTMKEWTAWVEQYTMVLFYSLKEYLCVMVKYNIGLLTVLQEHYQWNKFEQHCFSAMDIVRSKLCINQSRGRGRIFHGLQSELQELKKHQMACLYKVNKTHRTTRMLSSLSAVPVSEPVSGRLRRKIHQITYYRHLLPRLTDDDWLRCFGVSVAGRSLYRRWPTSRNERFTQKDQALVRSYLHSGEQALQIQVCTLPRHWYIEQYKSLWHRYECRGPLDPTAGIYYICTVCRLFKAFVQDHPKNTAPRGHHKIAYDVEQEQMFCAHKKGAPPHKTKLVPVQMLGTMVSCFGKCYVLCPQPNCGKPTRFHFRWVTAKGFACIACQKPITTPRSCHYCQEAVEDTAQAITVDEKLVHLCRRHCVHNVCPKWTRDSLWKTIQQRRRSNCG